jgi:hypothetical protein
MKELVPGRLSIIGTGFYISRYGLFMTAAHVLKDVIDKDANAIRPSFVCHSPNQSEIHLRRIVCSSIYLRADLAIGQADNYSAKYPSSPLQNMRARLSSRVPDPGSLVTTYAYPENEILDFRDPTNVPIVRSDYFDGQFLNEVNVSEHPELPYRHYETSILIKSGASGGPVFCNGFVIGVNCRGWDFGTDEDTLSYIVPVEAALDIEVSNLHFPEISWEYHQIPLSMRNSTLTVRQLIEFGHIEYTT